MTNHNFFRKRIVNVKTCLLVFELIVLLDHSFTFFLPLFTLLAKNERNKDGLDWLSA